MREPFAIGDSLIELGTGQRYVAITNERDGMVETTTGIAGDPVMARRAVDFRRQSTSLNRLRQIEETAIDLCIGDADSTDALTMRTLYMRLARLTGVMDAREAAKLPHRYDRYGIAPGESVADCFVCGEGVMASCHR